MSETFPENEVGLVRDYVGAAGADPAITTGSIAAALRDCLPGALIQERDPFHPHILINKLAVRRRDALLRVAGFLTDLTTVMAALEAVCQNIAKQEYGLAETGLAGVPQLGPTVTAADLSEAFATSSVFYIEVTGTPTNPDEVNHSLPGYAGPAEDPGSLLAAAQLMAGGPERDAQLDLLKAEIDVGRRDLDGLVRAVQKYLRLLPVARWRPGTGSGSASTCSPGSGPPVTCPRPDPAASSSPCERPSPTWHSATDCSGPSGASARTTARRSVWSMTPR